MMTVIFMLQKDKWSWESSEVTHQRWISDKTICGLQGASDVAVAPDGKLWVVDF